MDPKRKKIYIILGAVAVILAIGFWLWSRQSAPVEVAPIVTNSSASPKAAKPSADGSYPVPVLFPANKNLDTSVLDSTRFKILTPYKPVKIEPVELGRENPFNSY